MTTTIAAEKRQNITQRREAPLSTPSDLKAVATRDITAAMNGILADVFALYIKTKNLTHPIAERVRKLGGLTIRSIGHIARTQRLADNDAEYVEPSDMLAELREDNKTLTASLRQAHNVCDEHGDIATTSLIEI